MFDTIPLGRVTVPARKSRKTAPEAMPVISVPLAVVSNDPISHTLLIEWQRLLR